LLLGQSDVSAREAHYYYLSYKLQAVRSGPWKLALGPQGYSMGYKEDAEHRGVHTPGLRLYNLATDIGEQTNVAAQYPEVVKRLKTLADQEIATLGDSPHGPGVRPPGRVANPEPLYPMIIKQKTDKNAKQGANDEE